MLRTGSICLLMLGLVGCADLMDVPPPPVPLSALDGAVTDAAAGGAAPTSRRSTVALVRAAPAGALLTLHLPDAPRIARDFQQTSLAELFASREFKDLFGGGAFDQISLTGFRAHPALQGLSQMREFILCLEDVQVPSTPGAPPTVRGLLGVTIEGDPRQVEALIEMASAGAASDPKVQVEKGTIEQTSFTRIHVQDPVPMTIELAVHRDAVLAGIGQNSVTSAISRLQNPNMESIEDIASFRRSMERCSDPRDVLRMHLDVETVFSKYSRHFPEELQTAVAALGLQHVDALALSVRFDGKDLAISTLLDSPGGKDLFSALMSSHAVDRKFLTRVPANASSFSLFALDGRELLDHLRESLPAEGRRGLEDGLASIKKSGVDLEADVFEVFGPRCALVTIPAGRDDAQGFDAVWNHFLGVGLLVEVRDEAAAKRVLDRMPRTSSEANRLDYDVDGVPAVRYTPKGGQVPDGFALCYALHEGYLAVGLSGEALRALLTGATEKATAAFREATKDAPESVAVLSYDDPRQGVGLALGAMIAAARQDAADTDDPQPPVSLANVTRDWNTALSYTVADHRGVFSFVRSPTGGFGSVGGISGLAVVAAIAIPNLSLARIRANETATVATLHAIESAQAHYQAMGLRDSDGDGTGEYAFLAELIGKRRPGDSRRVPGRKLLTGMNEEDNGDLVRTGYYFRAYLPAMDGSPVGGHERPERLQMVDGDLAESIVVVVAWPVSQGSSGRRAFLLDAAGNLYECQDGDYGGDRAPPPDVMYSQEGNLASVPKPVHGKARDGFRWRKARE